jgi:integrase
MSTGSRFASEARRARWWARSSRVGSPTDHPPLAVPLNGATEVVFPSPKGALRDPDNTGSNLRRALDAAGFPWVTSHVFRKTVATLMDHAGLSSRAAADQLGHANTSMTTDVYFGRKVAATGAAAVLGALGDILPEI